MALIPGLLGIALLRGGLAGGLENRGLDQLFTLRGTLPTPPGVCVVAIDDDSYGVIKMATNELWPRALHGDLLRVLRREGAKAVAFDAVFSDPARDSAGDEAFRSALEETKLAVLGSSIEMKSDPQFNEATIEEPYEPFAKAAGGVGDVNFPVDDDGVIRHAWPMREGHPGLALAAYELGTGDLSFRSTEPRLIDYYGPPRTIKTVSYYQALDPKQYLPPGFFKDKIVFVGASQGAALGVAGQDAFLTPYHGRKGFMTFGVEIHASLAANYLERREIRLLDPRLEIALLLVLPLISSLVFMYLRPLAGGGAFLVLLVAPWVTGYLAFTYRSVWVPTVVPSAVQMPVSYGLSLIWYYLTTVREREKIKRAFGYYLAPEMIRQIAQDPDAVNLGGEEIVGTAVFTDIKGFTPIAEGLSAPETAAMLNAYFSEATRHVFDAGGTLIKYIGDAVFAIWGAPIHRPDHATQACVAALELARAQEASGHGTGAVAKLVTRIGVHTGPMLVGNLGSAQRFDYTAIGDAVNLASRIEGLNKAFGTTALASGEAIAATDGRFVTRLLGRARVVGRQEPVELHELVGIRNETARVASAVLDAFARGREAFAAGRFEEAAREFREARDASGGSDGPSAFFLEQAEGFAAHPPAAWDGVLVFESK